MSSLHQTQSPVWVPDVQNRFGKSYKIFLGDGSCIRALYCTGKTYQLEHIGPDGQITGAVRKSKFERGLAQEGNPSELRNHRKEIEAAGGIPEPRKMAYMQLLDSLG